MPSPLYLCLHVRDFAAQALIRARIGSNGDSNGGSNGDSNNATRSGAIAVLSGDSPLERIFAMNRQARILGLELGMSRVQAESFPVVLLRRDRQQEAMSFAELKHCAERISPRIETLPLRKKKAAAPRSCSMSRARSDCSVAHGRSQKGSGNLFAALDSTRGTRQSLRIGHNATPLY